MKIAVTGASGHIGSNICRELIARGYQVVALVYDDTEAIDGLELTIVKGNVLDRDSLRKLLTGCEGLIHSAGNITLGYKFNQKMYDVNVTGTKNVLEIAKECGVKRIVHFSSVHAFSQKPHDKPVTDQSRFIKDGESIYYDQTKRDGHLLALEAAKNGQEVMVVCPTAVLGAPDYKVSKLGQAIIDIVKGNVPASVKGGFDFVDVKDIAIGSILAMEKGISGHSYILGNEYHTIQSFGNLTLEASGSKKRLVELPIFLAYVGLPFIQLYSAITKRPPLYDKAYIDVLLDGNKDTSSDRAKKELGYAPRPLKETLVETVQFFRERGKI